MGDSQMSALNAGAGEWKPSVDASDFKPSWLEEENSVPVSSAFAPAPAASPALAPGPAPAVASEPEPLAAAGGSDDIDDGAMNDLADVAAKVAIEESKPEVVEAPADNAAVAPSKAPAAMFDQAGFEKEKTAQMAALQEVDAREHLNVVFIGHVDAGKSTLSGSILYEMGTVDKRTIEKFEQEAKERNRESWFLAYIMDTNDEERAKGKTVEVGRAYFETVKRRCTILDAPGHKNYVPAMISGASQADVGILVISARKGEFEAGFEGLGQTREHAMLAKTLGIQKLIVVINKMDEQTVQWSKERYDQCTKKLAPFLRGCGYKVKKDVIFMPLAALMGINVKKPVDPSVCAWAADINGNRSLIDTLDELVISGRDADKPLRMTVIDRYQDRGTVIMGKVEAGVVYVGQLICFCPNQIVARVDSILVNDQEVKGAKPGENGLVRCGQIGENDVAKGHIVCSKFFPVNGCTEVLAQIFVVGLLEHRPLFSAGYNAVFHAHTAEEECSVYELVAHVDTKTGKMQKGSCAFARAGQTIIAKIRLEKTICLESFDKTPSLGRFTLRDEGKTIAIGIVKRCK